VVGSKSEYKKYAKYHGGVKMLEINQFYNMDQLEGMRKLETGSIDMLLSDWPYGTTSCLWDKALPLQETWAEVKRVVKPNGAIVLFSGQPFTTDLINSNRKMFRYEIIWKKTLPQGFLNANKAPLRAHENILVFYTKLPTYNPQKIKVIRTDIGRLKVENPMRSKQYREMQRSEYVEQGIRYPTDVIEFSNWNGTAFGKTKNIAYHPTQKPIGLCEMLIKTYTNLWDTVLDNTTGSGSIPVACSNISRNFIAFDNGLCDKDGPNKGRPWVDIARDRLDMERAQMRFC
jgi:site-specific DNA-methyltransferase (adenine-specific)